jgi:ADP-ribose pyrophosphatase
MNQSPRVGPPAIVYENPFQRIERVEVDFGDFAKTYYVLESGTRTGVVIPSERGILLVRQWRLLIRDWSLEIPGGRVNPGEKGVEGALRECLEEAGIACRDLVPLVRYLPGMDAHHNPTEIYLARSGVEVGAFNPDPREVVERRWVPLEECSAMIDRGEIRCGLTIMGVLAYQAALAKGEA